jgi:hypothetical protein
MAWEWSPYLVDGGTRPDAITGLNDGFETSLANLFAGAPPEIQQQLRVMSAYRSPERQQQLWNEALVKYGTPEAARKWVAPPGNSQHNHGNAVDLRFLGEDAQKWVHANASQYGMHFPMSHEPWHIEPIGARGGNHAPNDGHNHGGNALAGGPTQGQPSQGNALAPQERQFQPVQIVAGALDPRAFMNQNALAPVAQFTTQYRGA